MRTCAVFRGHSMRLPFYLCATSAFLAVSAVSPSAWAAAPSTTPAAETTSVPTGTSAKDLGLTYLETDLSRQQLFEMIVKDEASSNPSDAAESIQNFNLFGPFRFPNDVDFDLAENKPRVNSIFGVDISHYTLDTFPIEQLQQRKVTFLYIKATQGRGGLDKKFASFWARAGSLPKGKQVHRGAYHFLSSTNTTVPAANWSDVEAAEWGKAQAEVFIRVVTANGGLRATDMPPVVDLEWDKATAEGPDRWKNRPKSQIFAMLNAYLEEVESKLGRKPMIYTARAWWHERIVSESDFASFSESPLWLADYSKSSRASEIPRSINGAKWALWQFTDRANMALGFNKGFDANIFKGKPDEFLASLGVEPFQ